MVPALLLAATSFTPALRHHHHLPRHHHRQPCDSLLPPPLRRLRGGTATATATAALDDTTNPDMPLVTLTNARDTVQIHLFGACVTSYAKDGRDLLAHRKDSAMDGAKPISGGIPFCFPHFGPGALQQHGFARNVRWRLAALTDGAEPSATLELTQSECATATRHPRHTEPRAPHGPARRRHRHPPYCPKTVPLPPHEPIAIETRPPAIGHTGTPSPCGRMPSPAPTQ